MPIRTRRWDDPAEPEDGLRVLVCRYRPRGLKKEFETWTQWIPELGPSAELHAAAYGKHGLKLNWDAYRRRYLQEMKRPEAQARIQGLAYRVQLGDTVTLLCSSACVREGRCHRSLLADLITNAVGLIPKTGYRKMYQVDDVTVRVPAHCYAGLTGIPAENISVEWDPRETQLAAEAAEYLEARWQHYLADAKAHGKTLFNGTITRLIHTREVRAAGEGDSWHSGDRIVLRLGPADYKSFLVTRLRDRAWFARHASAAEVLALGNSALLTCGDDALLGIRSAHVSAYAGRAHLLGGVLEMLGTERYPATIGGIIAHLQSELHEEAGVTTADLHPGGNWPRFLGIAEDQALSQPEAIWQWESRTPMAEIGRRLDPAEHSGCILIRRGHMTEERWRRMTPVARYTWRTWSGLK